MSVSNGKTGYVFAVMTEVGSAHEKEMVGKFPTAEKFLFTSPYLTFELFKGGIDFASQLAVHGLLRLPYDLTLFQYGPVIDEDPEAPMKVHDYIALAWMDGDVIAGRLFITDGISVKSCEETYRIPTNTSFLQWRDWPDEGRSLISIDEFPRGPLLGDTPLTGEPFEETVGLGFFAMIIFGSLGCLAAKGVRLENVREPKFTNRQRSRNGDHPIFGHNLVLIDMQAARMPGIVAAGGHHASPRLHWRRGHVRRTANGGMTIVRPCLVGHAENGIVTKTYAVGSSHHSR